MEIYEMLKSYDDFDERIIKLIHSYQDGLEKMKAHSPKAYREGMTELRDILDDWHFDDDILEEASASMINADGTYGFKYSKEQVKDNAKRNSYNVDNMCDFTYVVNMLYSDYSQILGNDLNMYLKLAKAFIEDRDGPTGKALRYYIAMH